MARVEGRMEQKDLQGRVDINSRRAYEMLNGKAQSATAGAAPNVTSFALLTATRVTQSCLQCLAKALC
jgi:hypothetical protein